MKNAAWSPFVWLRFGGVSIVVVAALVLVFEDLRLWRQTRALSRGSDQALMPSCIPWESVGGCGAGGSGGAGGGGVQWVGKGVSGGFLDLELMSSLDIGQTRRMITLSPRFTFKPTYITTVGLTIPILSKVGQFSAQGQYNSSTEVTGGTGDLSLDVSRTFGLAGQYSGTVALTLPTAQYDIKRKKDGQDVFLNSMLQLGTGLYNASLSLGYTHDIEDGMFLFNLSCAYPFALTFGKTNSHNDELWEYETANMSEKDRRRFEGGFKPYGENELGAYTPPSLAFSAIYGNRKHDGYIHSLQLNFSVPLGVAWVHGANSSVYDPRVDSDFQTWSGSIGYGLELFRPDRPIFLGISKTIHDKGDDPDGVVYDPDMVNQWNGPDWKDFWYSWGLFVGFKSILF